MTTEQLERTWGGLRTGSAAERAWMDAATALGCIACILDGHPGTPGAIHHLLRGGRRMGHMHTICLCDPGHHQNGQARGMVSRHPHKAEFEARYGTEDSLLGRTQALVGMASAELELDDYDAPDEPVCPHCHGDGMDPMTDYLLPCKLCQGEQRP